MIEVLYPIMAVVVTGSVIAAYLFVHFSVVKWISVKVGR